jgi:hypothetical protein
MDGFATRQTHEILRQKTLVFIGNNFSHPHENNIALAKIVPGWIQRLNALLACIEYALVPDGFWKEQGKKLISKIAAAGRDRAAEVAEKFLRKPAGK